jgi:hypothetical protein
MQRVGLGIRIRQLRIDSRFSKRFASHLKEANKVVVFASMVRYFDDFGKVGRIFSLDVRVCKKSEVSSTLKERVKILRTNRVLDPQAIQLGLSESAPNFTLVDFVGVIESTINRHYVLDKNVDSHRVLIVLLVDRQRLLI